MEIPIFKIHLVFKFSPKPGGIFLETICGVRMVKPLLRSTPIECYGEKALPKNS